MTSEMQPAAVRPRVRLQDSGEALLLEDVLEPLLGADLRGAVRLHGPPGSGRATALNEIARICGAVPGLRILHRPDLRGVEEAAREGLVIHDGPAVPSELVAWALEPWDQDACLEYLLASAPEECARVLAEAASEKDGPALLGSPELWVLVLDRLVADPRLGSVRAALRAELDESDHERLVELRSRHLALRALWRAREFVDFPLLGLARFEHGLVDEEELHEVVIALREREEARRSLHGLLIGPEDARQAHAATLLHLAEGGWSPARGTRPCLREASLPGARWGGLSLEKLDVRRGDLTRADLHGACLRRGLIGEVRAVRANFSGVDAERLMAGHCVLRSASLRGARLERAVLMYADLRDALLDEASLESAVLNHARLQGASLRDCNLRGAALEHCDLSASALEGAQFDEAHLQRANLSGVELPGARLEGACLQAADLTGSRMPDARLRGADLKRTGLAEIAWTRADLREADLRGASFHPGSTRSGLLSGAPASWGTRTGFYTEDLRELAHHSPELARKADLREADLRGARLDGLDWYLIDLRGARLDPEARGLAARCGALLD